MLNSIRIHNENSDVVPLKASLQGKAGLSNQKVTSTATSKPRKALGNLTSSSLNSRAAFLNSNSLNNDVSKGKSSMKISLDTKPKIHQSSLSSDPASKISSTYYSDSDGEIDIVAEAKCSRRAPPLPDEYTLCLEDAKEKFKRGYNVFDEDDGPEALSNYKASQVVHNEEYFTQLENKQRMSVLQEATLAYEQEWPEVAFADYSTPLDYDSFSYPQSVSAFLGEQADLASIFDGIPPLDDAPLLSMPADGDNDGRSVSL